MVKWFHSRPCPDHHYVHTCGLLASCIASLEQEAVCVSLPGEGAMFAVSRNTKLFLQMLIWSMFDFWSSDGRRGLPNLVPQVLPL